MTTALLIVSALLASSPPAKNVAPSAPGKLTLTDVPPSPGAGAAAPIAAVKTWEGFSTPESVLYDAETDMYLVSNINGLPLTVDNNGFISRIAPEGEVTLKWIEGGKNGVTLNGPKGMGISKGVLYVADISTVRKFDVKTGKPLGEVAISKATFVNDVAVGPDGAVYASDSGLKAGAKDFEPSGTDGVYLIEKNGAKALAKAGDMGKPNGVLVGKGGLQYVTFGSNELVSLDAKGVKTASVKLPKGGLDGVVLVDGEMIISSWEGSALYRGKPEGPFTEWKKDVKAPADIGLDTKRKWVLVPRFMDHKVEAYGL
jgi:sugar lactone lactonase YvrE